MVKIVEINPVSAAEKIREEFQHAEPRPVTSPVGGDIVSPTQRSAEKIREEFQHAAPASGYESVSLNPGPVKLASSATP